VAGQGMVNVAVAYKKWDCRSFAELADSFCRFTSIGAISQNHDRSLAFSYLSDHDMVSIRPLRGRGHLKLFVKVGYRGQPSVSMAQSGPRHIRPFCPRACPCETRSVKQPLPRDSAAAVPQLAISKVAEPKGKSQIDEKQSAYVNTGDGGSLRWVMGRTPFVLTER
jgi:hypothetical protein